MDQSHQHHTFESYIGAAGFDLVKFLYQDKWVKSENFLTLMLSIYLNTNLATSHASLFLVMGPGGFL